MWSVMKIISWNIAHRKEPWSQFLNTQADVALLQEASDPPPEVLRQIKVDDEPWVTHSPGKHSPWRTAIVKLSNNVTLEWIKPAPIGQAQWGQLAVSRLGTLSAAKVHNDNEPPIILISMYGFWEKPHESTGSSWLYADASVHRLISDISVLIGSQTKHRIIASGDLNILYGYGEHGSQYWASRYATIFSRMEALGLKFVGPQAPNGRGTDPWPAELPSSSKNVPTYFSSRQNLKTATRQLDYVFASESIADRVSVTALNQPDEWGPSDHCRILIEF
jgi:exonuclease III